MAAQPAQQQFNTISNPNIPSTDQKMLLSKMHKKTQHLRSLTSQTGSVSQQQQKPLVTKVQPPSGNITLPSGAAEPKAPETRSMSPNQRPASNTISLVNAKAQPPVPATND